MFIYVLLLSSLGSEYLPAFPDEADVPEVDVPLLRTEAYAWSPSTADATAACIGSRAIDPPPGLALSPAPRHGASDAAPTIPQADFREGEATSGSVIRGLSSPPSPRAAALAAPASFDDRCPMESGALESFPASAEGVRMLGPHSHQPLTVQIESIASDGRDRAVVAAHEEENPGDGPGSNREEPDESFELDPVADPLGPPHSGPDISAWESALDGITPRIAHCASESDQRDQIRRLVKFFRAPPPAGEPRDLAAAEELLQKLPNVLRDPESFVSGSFSRHFAAWEELIGNSGRKSSRQVLGWLKDGVKPILVGTSEAKPSKRDLVVGMLKKVVPVGEIPHLLSGQFPHPVEFEKHRSFYDNWEFSSEAVNKLLLWSAASETPPGTPQPVVINPLGVADPTGKERLICNSCYPNLFLQALPFRYERLRDILAFTKEGSFMASWDLKAGYYHVPIHPAFRKYFGFRVGKRVFQFNVVFFGFSQACYVFTKIMQEPFLELRAVGIPVSGYVDDGLTAAITYFLCLHRLLVAVLLQAALGAFHSLPKCQFKPVQLLDWL